MGTLIRPAEIFMSIVIAKLRKSSSEELWITIDEFKGVSKLDLRIYFRSLDVPQPHPTKKGVTFDLPQARELLAALERFDADDTQVEIVKKKRADEVRIYSATFADRRMIHIRTFYRPQGEADLKHSSKGVTFDPSLLEKVTEGVELAVKQLGR